MNKFAKQLSYLSIVILIFTIVFTNPSKIYASSILSETKTILNNKDDCGKTKGPNAPCRGEVFQTETLTRSTTRSVTCGVNIYTATGTKVATISETVSFTISASQMVYTVNSASRSTWVKNSSYQWRNLSGPTPNSGNVNYSTGPSTVGDLYFLGAYWNTWRTRLIVTSSSSWYCQ